MHVLLKGVSEIEEKPRLTSVASEGPGEMC